MPTPKDLSSYPEWFFTIAERAMREGYSERLQCLSNGAAMNLRQRFYAFRQILSRQQHPHAPGALSLVLTIQAEGQHTWLRFDQSLGLSPEAFKQLGIFKQESLLSGANAPDRVMASDAAEDALNELLKIGQLPVKHVEPEAAPECTVHEWDETETFCMKCRRPKS